MTAKMPSGSDLLELIRQMLTFLHYPSEELTSIPSPVARGGLESNSANFLQLKCTMAFVDRETSTAFDTGPKAVCPFVQWQDLR